MDHKAVGESAKFWLEFSVPSSSCIQNLSFSWYIDSTLAKKVVPIQESANVFNSTFIINNISEADYGPVYFKVSDKVLQTFYIVPLGSK